ncbi:MAG: hypothetical protein ABIQ06_12100 [Caldimonas sp.]
MSTLLAPFLRRLGAAALVAIVAGCGGGGGGGAAPPVVPPAAVVIGSAGGVVHGPDGVSVTIPAGALAADTSLQIIATTAAAALPLPAGVTARPQIYSLLPHGTRFSVPVTLSVPRGAADPADTTILKTNSEGTAWEQLVTDSVGANYSALVVGFSYMTMCGGCVPNPNPPVISMQPASGSVNEGGLVFLSVSAIGAQPFTYTWISSRQGRLGPQASPAIVVNPVTLADDGLQLRVEVKDRFGLITVSGPGIVTVIPAAPVVVSEPIDVSAVEGTTALFSALTRSSVAQQINWQRFDPGMQQWGASLSSTNQLSLPNVSRAIDDQALFRMTAQNVGGGPVVTTRTARLTVLAAEMAPAIQSQPQDVATVAGRSAVFGVVASGGGLDFDWRRSDDQGASWSGRLPGSGSAQFVISNVTSADDGALFRVVVQNTVAPPAQSATARLVVAPSVGSAPVRVGGGRGHSMALRADATLVAWGDNGLGQLGRGSFSAGGEAAQAVSGLSRVATFSVGGSHTLAIDDLGAVSAWGATGNGVLGDPAVRDGSRPVSPIGIVGPARFVAAGVSTSLAATGNDFYSWGSGYHGDGRFAVRDTATPTGFSFVAAAAGRGNFTLALTGDGTVWAWGSNGAGQLGTGDRGARTAPEVVAGLPRSVAVSAGANHSLALGEDGVVWAWGNNFFGQLGLGDGLDRTRPVAVVLPGIAIAIAVGDLHSLALLADGRVFAWGFNTEGQVGRGDSLDSLAPVNVAGGWSGRIVGIGAGNRHSLAVDAAGAVWAWGLNDTMQLGDGTRTARNRPVQTQGVNLN